MNKSLHLSFAPDIGAERSDTGVPKHFSGIAYSGGLIPGYSYFGNAVIDLDSMTLPDKAVFALLNHDVNQRTGKCFIEKHENQLRVRGDFSASSKAGQQVASEFAEGAPWEFSIGIHSEPEIFPKQKEMVINGQTLTVDTVFRKARILEVSFVPAGADPKTEAIAFEQTIIDSTPYGESMDEVVKDPLASVHQLNTDLQNKFNAFQAASAETITDLKVQLSAEAEKFKAATEQLSAVTAELNQFKKDVRLSAVKALFSELNREWNDADAQPYIEMTDTVFSAVAHDLRALKPKVNPALFQEFAANGKEGTPERALVAQLFDQVASNGAKRALATQLFDQVASNGAKEA